MSEDKNIEFTNENNKAELTDFSPKLGEMSEGQRGDKTSNHFTQKINNLSHLKSKRKTLRKNLTQAEAMLWKNLKGKQLEGRKFRRQHSLGNYILDFYCPSQKLAIGLDGKGHFNMNQIEYDKNRTLYLNELGIKVIRFENKTVFENIDFVLKKIKMEFK